MSRGALQLRLMSIGSTSGYRSWQVVVEWKKSPPFKELKSLKVEIQVGTVVMQAWAEVQHNIIYKRPADALSTPAMRRMIDAINGLAITTEIMLKQLERSMEQAKKDNKALYDTLFDWRGDGTEFLDWFRSVYLNRIGSAERQRWVDTPRWANTLSHGTAKPSREEVVVQYRALGFQSTHGYFANLIKKHNLLQTETKGGEKLDISDLILNALGCDVLQVAGGWALKDRN